MEIKYFGKAPHYSSLKVNALLNNKMFCDASDLGFELMFPYEDTEVTSETPFKTISEKVFSLVTKTSFVLPEKHNLLILPHHISYFDDNAPKVIVTTVEADWWCKSIEVLFQNKPCKFKKDEPFAQVIVIPRNSPQLSETEPPEMLKWMEEEGKGYMTRDDNLYEVLSTMNERRQLPHQQIKIVTNT